MNFKWKIYVYQLVAAGLLGLVESITFIGKSKIVAPLGKSITEAEGEDGFICAELDSNELAELREGYYALLKDRNRKAMEN